MHKLLLAALAATTVLGAGMVRADAMSLGGAAGSKWRRTSSAQSSRSGASAEGFSTTAIGGCAASMMTMIGDFGTTIMTGIAIGIATGTDIVTATGIVTATA